MNTTQIPAALSPSMKPDRETAIKRMEASIADLERTLSKPGGKNLNVERQCLISSRNMLRILKAQ